MVQSGCSKYSVRLDDHSVIATRRGSWRTRRRSVLRSHARSRKRGSVFWASFLAVLHAKPCLKSWPDSSPTTSSMRSERDSCFSWSAFTDDASLDVASSINLNFKADGLPNLMHHWVSTVIGSDTYFGAFAYDFIGGIFPVSRGRSRDVLPLPVISAQHLQGVAWRIDKNLVVVVVNLVNAALNWLFFGGVIKPIPKTPTALHLRVIHRIYAKIDCAFVELAKTNRYCKSQGSFHAFTHPHADARFPQLRAHDVDVLPAAGRLDVSNFLPEDVNKMFSRPDELFPTGVRHIPAKRVCREGNRGDRVCLTIRMLRAGRLSLMKHPEASADTFVIAKRDSCKQREIWNGSQITSAAVASLKPPMQASPASSATLEASDDRPQSVSCRDGRIFFDQLQVPPQLRPYFGRPLVSVKDLKEPPPCESSGVVVKGLDDDEIQSYMLDGPVTCDSEVAPVSNCWPMGFGWSSYVAQSTMVSTCLQAGFTEGDILSDERLLLPGVDRALAIATDDVNLFQRMSDAELRATSRSPLEGLDREWDRIGLQGHPDKASDLLRSSRVLGLELRDGISLQAGGNKMWTILETCIDLMSFMQASPEEVSVLNGHFQWQNLIDRPLYACLHKIYHFTHLLPYKLTRKLPKDVASEILVNAALFPFWSADLRRPWWSFMAATDASPSYGFGLSIANCDAGITRAVAAFAADPTNVIRLSRLAGDAEEVPREGQTFRLPLTMDDFKTAFSIKAKEVSHSGAMELNAVKLALLRLTRTSRTHSHRGVILVDAQAVGFALRKGRSSAGTLNFGVKAVAAISLAADLKLSFPYLPSESNPADFPSRGKVRQRIRKKRPRFRHFSTPELIGRAYRKAFRRWRDCNVSVF